MSNDSLVQVTRERPNPELLGVLMSSTDAELAAFLKFDPEKYCTEAPGMVGFDLDLVARNPQVTIDAQIMEVDRKGRYILRRYNKESLKQRLQSAPIRESRPTKALSLLEAWGYMPGSLKALRENLSWDPDRATTNAFDSFTPLFIGPFYRQQYMYRMLEAKSKAFAAYTTNPVAKRIVSIITQFVLSKGVVATFEDPEAQKLWDSFTQYNKIGVVGGKGNSRAGSRLRMWSDMLSVDGELFFDFKDKGDMLKVDVLDSATILDVVTNPADINEVYYYHQQYATPYNQYSMPGVPATHYILRQIPAADVLHVKINVFENEKRGRSDLYTILGWLKRLKDLVNANVIRSYFHACYTWDYTIKGNSTDVKNFATRNQAQVPVPGSSYVHNEGVTRTLVSPTGVAGSGVDHDLMGLINMLALGSGISTAYLAASFAGSRAGALTETEPSAKMFYDRQTLWDETFHGFADRLFNWAESKGIHITNRKCEFSFPQINPMEKQALVNLLTTMSTNKWFKAERCASIIAKELAVTSYDYREEQLGILNEAKEAIDREFEENKYRSLSETKLQVWQTYFAHLGANEEQSRFGKPSPTGETDAPGSPVASANPSAKKGGKGGEISGGMSEEQRARVERGGR